MFKRNKIEVVPAMGEAEYEKERNMRKYVTRKEVAIATAIPTLASIGLATYQFAEKITATAITTTAPLVYAEASNVIPVAMPQPTGAIADASLTMLANVLDPVIQILVAFSFPLASVIMVGAGFFFMLGQSERAWDIIFKCGMGYLFIQLSPLLLGILKTVGEAV